ncbi:MAG: SpoIIE family protein phosphatase, partial [Mycobacterium sp.]
MGEQGRLGPIEWAAEARSYPGERVCGDHPIAVGVADTGALVGVLDGVGHGKDAARAALCGVEVLRDARAEPLD